jgi:hypothetical protein
LEHRKARNTRNFVSTSEILVKIKLLFTTDTLLPETDPLQAGAVGGAFQPLKT